VTVDTYNSGSGVVTFTTGTSIKHYHWGASASTADNYNGVDIRGEVLLLTRNIQIIGEDIESWGGQIVTSDTIDGFNTDGTIKMRSGQLIMDNVQVYNCSQANTMKAAVRFEGAAGSWSSVTNSAIHNGFGWGLGVYKSANVHVKDNIFWGFRAVGVSAISVRNFTFDSNFVGHVMEREVSGQMFVDRRAGVAICSLDAGVCSGLKIINNIVAGTTFSGYAMVADDCNSTQATSKFWNNIAHSINAPQISQGVYVFPDPANPA
jgi:hypothetical protein